MPTALVNNLYHLLYCVIQCISKIKYNNYDIRPSLSLSLSQTFNNWMDNTSDDLHEPPICNSVTESEQLVASFDQWKTDDLQTANEQYDEINGFVTVLADLGSTENPYTTLTPTVSWSHDYRACVP